MIKKAIGLALGFGIGLGCAFTGIPVPAPPILIGSLMVVAMTLGFITMDQILKKESADE